MIERHFSKELFLVLISAIWMPSVECRFACAEEITTPDTHSTNGVRDSWPRFLGKNADGVANVTAKIDWSKQPKFLWSTPVGAGYGLGAVVDNRYYHFDANSIERTERLTCADMSNGKTLWTVNYPLEYRDMYGYEPGPRSGPTIDQDRIYTMGVGGRLTCRRLSDGEEVWNADTNVRYSVVQNFFGVGGAPLIFDDSVIVMVGGSPPEDLSIPPGQLDRVAPAGTALVAYDKLTGKEKWKVGNDLASYSSPRIAELQGETLILLFARDGLLAVDASTGKEKWKVRHRADILESVNAMVPIVSGNHVFISECYAVGSLLLEATSNDSVKTVWKDPPRDRRRQAMRVHWSNPALVDGYLYGCSGRNAPDSDFRCIEFKTGKVAWVDPRKIRSSVTPVGDHLIVLEERGYAEVLKANPEKMEQVAEWELQLTKGDRKELNYPCWAAPIVIGDRVLVRGDEQVVCLKLATE